MDAIQQQQYLTQYPTSTFDSQQQRNNKYLSSFDSGPNSKKEHPGSSKASHLEMYKSIPLKNLKKIRGTAANNKQNHFKHMSNNYQLQQQFQTIGVQPTGAQTELGPFNFGTLGDYIPGTFDATLDSQNLSIINQIN